MIRNASPIAFVPEVQAVTSVITGPLRPRRMDTRADVMFAIIIGTANGLTRPGPFSNNVSYTSWIESIPPIPVPTTVPLTVEPGPFIVVTGHDLHDLNQLLEQTDGKGVNIYTHGEMLPCHAYPELKKHPQLKVTSVLHGKTNKKEFVDVPGAFLFTTNCIMPPKENYRENIFTTDMVGFDGCAHIEENADGTKDFSAVINRAIELGGYKEAQEFTGINGGHEVTTGFGHGTVLGIADTVIDAVKAGAIKHFFLVGGCDGAKVGRNYYTDFVKQTPEDTVVLTLACGKFRFNDLNIGEIGGIPRILDMGQCNDAYSAIQVAVALAGAFECDVNDLPLTLVLSWYEQKAVCILLTFVGIGYPQHLHRPILA